MSRMELQPAWETAERLRSYLTSRSIWARALLLLSLGGLAATAFPPLHLVFFLIPAFTGLFWLLDDSSGKRDAFFTGWLFGIGHFSVGFYWVGHAFLVDSARYGWMAPFAVIGLACGLALFPALVALVSKGIWSRRIGSATGRVLVFAILWTLLEAARGWVLTGFPWNQIGSVWAFSDVMLQSLSLFGVSGLGLLTVIAATMPGVLAYTSRANRPVWALAMAILPLAAILLFGLIRLPDGAVKTVDGVVLRLVQPNIPQHLKWKPDLRMSHVRTLARLSLAPPQEGAGKPTHLIWPETAVPFNLQQDKNLLKGLGDIVPLGGLLLTGAPRSSAAGATSRTYWNSLIAVSPEGSLAGFYDKQHLVPFGEYVPWRSVLSLTKLTEGRSDFSKGETPRTFALEGLPAFAPLICYEIIFAEEVRSLGPSPAWLLNITNDAWFGHSSGPYQHLALSRFRAVELGRAVVRVANTGISALIDPYGRVLQQLRLGEEGILDVRLPHSANETTVYSRFGDLVVLVMMGFCGMILFLFRQ